jgi:predicted RND superfamily exporter protein
METEVAKALIDTKEPIFIWVGIALFAMQIIFIPSIVFLFKHFNKVHDDKISAQREVTQLTRDAQHKEHVIWQEKHEMQHAHKDEENNMILNTIAKNVEEIANRQNEMYRKMYNID